MYAMYLFANSTVGVPEHPMYSIVANPLLKKSQIIHALQPSRTSRFMDIYL